MDTRHPVPDRGSILPLTLVISVVLFGDVPERTLKNLAEEVRDQLTAKPNISQADLAGVRRFEISIEIADR